MDGRLTETNKCGVGTALGNKWHRTPSPRAGPSIGGLLPRVKAHPGDTLWAPLPRGLGVVEGVIFLERPTTSRSALPTTHQRRGSGTNYATAGWTQRLFLTRSSHFIPLASCGYIGERGKLFPATLRPKLET